eukprot:TRINITY_DN3879_c0_g1_i1.p1 TRINITY_DN3879_c0_g1~~TRINITY_DN3879_c0_g1_i1.p1  ORF type:complete len:383 (-),score=94.13 TRINITY_DN3879_c0_g1_i1:37-1185(-)
MIRRPPRSTQGVSSAASDVYKRQVSTQSTWGLQMDTGKWCTIESDPGVFTEMIRKFGVKGVQVEELATLEKEEFIPFKKVYGLIFLFKWKKEIYQEKKDIVEVPELFFANQVITNACATQAIISVLLNSTDLDIGEELQGFKDFAISLDPKQRGMALEGAEGIRQAHNSFTHPEPFEFEEVAATEKDDVFHFVAYVPFQGVVYELDGIQKGPIKIGEISESLDWISVAKTEIMKRMQTYQEEEIHFNLLAIVSDMKVSLNEDLQQAITLSSHIGQKLGLESDVPMGELPAALPDSPEELKKLYDDTKNKIYNIQNQLLNEEEKQKKWEAENIRRRHNYLPFIFEVLKVLATKGRLPDLLKDCLLYTSPSPRDLSTSRMPSSA